MANAAWIRDAVIDGDPAGFLPAAALDHMVASIQRRGVKPSPPLLGGESNPAYLVHNDPVCLGCKGTMQPQVRFHIDKV